MSGILTPSSSCIQIVICLGKRAKNNNDQPAWVFEAVNQRTWINQFILSGPVCFIEND
jgi:hypothetical protein